MAYSHKILNQGSYYLYIFAFARMNYADYPGLQSGGWLWFKDLTQYDPYFLLPAISAVIIFSTYYVISYFINFYVFTTIVKNKNQF